MTDLASIPGIGRATLELLEAAGFSNAEALSVAGVDELSAELERANRILQISKRAPTRGNIKKWIDAARDITGSVEAAEQAPVAMPVNYELSPQVVEMLSGSPFAIPLPARILMEQKLAVGDIPPAILLNRYSGDLEVRVEDRSPSPSPKPRPQPQSSFVHISQPTIQRYERFDGSRLRSTEDVGVGSQRVATAPKEVNENDRVALIRGPRKETNEGRDPRSRFYIRGVLHSHPATMILGAFFTLLLALMLPLAVTATTLLLLSDAWPEKFPWVAKWWLAFPCSIPLIGLGWMIWGQSGKCRICTQKLFVPRMCLKNAKAHHVRGLGYIIPLSVHILLFRWFRCTYCGTPVRLKK